MVTILQSEITKTAAFNGAAVDISSLAAPYEIEVTVDALLAGATAIFELQSSADNFSSDVRVERALSFGATGAINAAAAQSKTLRDFDLPGLRVGTAGAKLRLALSYLDAGALTLEAPGTVTATAAESGGTLAADTYDYKVTALGNGGETLPSPEASATITGSTGSVDLSWDAVAGATSYRIYRGTSAGGENVYFTSDTNSFTDTGAAGTAGTPPAANSTGSPSVSYSGFLKR